MRARARTYTHTLICPHIFLWVVLSISSRSRYPPSMLYFTKWRSFVFVSVCINEYLCTHSNLVCCSSGETKTLDKSMNVNLCIVRGCLYCTRKTWASDHNVWTVKPASYRLLKIENRRLQIRIRTNRQMPILTRLVTFNQPIKRAQSKN